MLFPANTCPHIYMAPIFNVTVGVSAILRVNVTDPDGDNVTLQLIGELPSGAQFDRHTGIFSWTPEDTTRVVIL